MWHVEGRGCLMACRKRGCGIFQLILGGRECFLCVPFANYSLQYLVGDMHVCVHVTSAITFVRGMFAVLLYARGRILWGH